MGCFSFPVRNLLRTFGIGDRVSLSGEDMGDLVHLYAFVFFPVPWRIHHTKSAQGRGPSHSVLDRDGYWCMRCPSHSVLDWDGYWCMRGPSHSVLDRDGYWCGKGPSHSVLDQDGYWCGRGPSHSVLDQDGYWCGRSPSHSEISWSVGMGRSHKTKDSGLE